MSRHDTFAIFFLSNFYYLFLDVFSLISVVITWSTKFPFSMIIFRLHHFDVPVLFFYLCSPFHLTFVCSFIQMFQLCTFSDRLRGHHFIYHAIFIILKWPLLANWIQQLVNEICTMQKWWNWEVPEIHLWLWPEVRLVEF